MEKYLYEELSSRSGQEKSFHMPGHKNGKAVPAFIEERLPKGLLEWDQTETEGLDNLRSPACLILDAEKRAAGLYGASDGFFLLNGSSSGIKSAVSAVAAGGTVYAPRDTHISVFEACVLSGADLVSLPAGLPAVPENLSDGSKALVVTCPGYKGNVEGLSDGTVKEWQAAGVTVIVDEAHGAHLPFLDDEDLKGAVAGGADFAVQSWHKVFPVPGQTALLLSGGKYSRNGIQRHVNIHQTTSPSYIMMGMADLCGRWLAGEGRSEIKENAENLLRQFGKGKKWNSFHIEPVSGDPFKINLKVHGRKGIALASLLSRTHGIIPEYCFPDEILFMLPVSGTSFFSCELLKALNETDGATESLQGESVEETYGFFLPERVLAPRESFYAGKREIPLRESAGEVCGDEIMAFPPGIPVLLPGEKIEKRHLEIIRAIDPGRKTIAVITGRDSGL